MEQATTLAIVHIKCPHCGDMHRVIPGVGTPIYWCGDKLMSLNDEDNVEYEETPEVYI